MLRKMRWRFICAAMIAFSIVVIGLLCIINIGNYRDVARRQDEIIQSLIQAENDKAPPKERPRIRHQGFSDEVRYMIRFFAVSCDADGGIQAIHRDYIASVSDDMAVTYTRNILEKKQSRGYYEGYRYNVMNMDSKTNVFFLNSERELQAVHSLLRLTSIISACCLLIVFILVTVLSQRAIAPYVRNIETQKQFITGASHELKTPLTAISTSADVLALELEDNEWVQNIQKQSGRMSRLIADLVTLSRLDEENPYPEKANFSLSEAVWELSEQYAAQVKTKGKEYVQHIDNDIMMLGDKRAIQQMVSILLDNAQKYSPTDGRIQLNVSRKQRKIEISVYNTCHVENYRNIGRIFDRFYRLDNAHFSGESYGIGLSIAKAIAENHRGTIRAESRQGNDMLVQIIL